MGKTYHANPGYKGCKPKVWRWIQETEGNAGCNVNEGWKKWVNSPTVYVRRESTIIRFCATVARSCSTSDVRNGVKWSLHKTSQSFVCESCNIDRPITRGLSTDLDFDIGNGYHWIRQINSDKFSYLWYIMQDADGGCDSADRWPESHLHRNSFVNTYPYWVQMVLNKTDREGIYVTCVSQVVWCVVVRRGLWMQSTKQS